MTTKIKAGVIGWPIKHSRSPIIHGFWLKQHQINGSYDKIPVEPDELSNFISSLKQNGLSGINITVPHKIEALKLADLITPDAKAIGAANTLWFEDGQLIAGNTDAHGFITHLKTKAPTWKSDKPAMVMGAGGAARAILYALLKEGVPQIKLTNRTTERAENLASEFNKQFSDKISVIEWNDKQSNMDDCSLLVNSTSLGMNGNPPLEINIDTLPAKAVVYDIVYAPLETDLLKSAKTRGLTAVDGLGMLLHQAVPGFEKWFGIRPKVTDELYQLVVDDLEKDA